VSPLSSLAVESRVPISRATEERGGGRGRKWGGLPIVLKKQHAILSDELNRFEDVFNFVVRSEVWE
jgi:hypothetical protein